MKYTPISISPEQTQFLETRNFQINGIVRIFPVPPHADAPTAAVKSDDLISSVYAPRRPYRRKT